MIALELLLIKIRNDPCIKGIKIDNPEVKLAAFADDLTTFLQDKGSLEHLFSTLKAFEGCSGLKLKRPRLRISRIGGQARKIENPDNLPEEHLWGTIFENVIVIF